MRILVIGDVHGSFGGKLNPLISVQQPDIILAAGDFGYWPRIDKKELGAMIKNRLRNGNRCEIRFCDGNHEDHAELRKLVGDSRQAVELGPNIFYQPRGSTFTLPDGRLVLFVGGAKSVDWRDREEGIDWFREEILVPDDLPDSLPGADIVVSHTAPNLFPLQRGDHRDLRWDSSPDPSRQVLDWVFKEVRPRLWFCGHFHKQRSGELDGTRWMALGAAQVGGRWWMDLDWQP